MSYSSNPVTENERNVLYRLGWFGLADAALALVGHFLGGDAKPFTWLLTVIAASLLFSQVLNYRARDEYYDRLVLSGARWSLGLMGIWISAVSLLTMFLRNKSLTLSPILTDQMITLCAVMVAYFAGFCLARWRSA